MEFHKRKHLLIKNPPMEAKNIINQLNFIEMAVFYKLYQDNRQQSRYKGQWYARASHPGVKTVDDLADVMQNNCTVKRSDILAVISELVETMTNELQNSNTVKIDRFGSFRINLSSSPAPTPDEFDVAKHVRSLKVIFQPEVKIGKDKTRNKTFLKGCRLKELPVYDPA